MEEDQKADVLSFQKKFYLKPLKKGKMTNVLPSPFGYHLVLLFAMSFYTERNFFSCTKLFAGKIRVPKQ